MNIIKKLTNLSNQFQYKELPTAYSSQSDSKAPAISSKNQFLLDVRTPQEFHESHVKNSINIPMNEIPNNLKKLSNIKETILIICRSGARAHTIQDFLIQNNITNTKVLEGGILKHGTNFIN